MKYSAACLLMAVFWMFVLLPTLPAFLLILGIGKAIGATEVSFWEFTRDWLTFRIIP
jgi:hypothetical protein